MPDPTDAASSPSKPDLKTWIKSLLSRKETQADELREALEGYIEELSDRDSEPLSAAERGLIANILNLRELTVSDVMIPRADIVAIDVDTAPLELLMILSEKSFSRIAVYRETLDDILGTIHVKDVMAQLARNRPVVIAELVRETLIVSPALPVISMIVMMKEKRKHLAFVVDEYGGIDGMLTIGDLIESIIGRIADEHENDHVSATVELEDGILVDGRAPIEDVEARFGPLLSEDEREEIDTLGGFIFAVASRVPDRGEIIAHDESGLSFEILEANPRRIMRVRIRSAKEKLPEPGEAPH
jgi:magnesium and cobalt transporter